MSIGSLGTNYSEILIEIQKFSFMKMHFKTSCAKWRPFCTGRDELHVETVGRQTTCPGQSNMWFVTQNDLTDLYMYTPIANNIQITNDVEGCDTFANHKSHQNQSFPLCKEKKRMECAPHITLHQP